MSMIDFLPAIADKVIPRPMYNKQYLPDLYGYASFWNDLYEHLKRLDFVYPTKGTAERIDTYTGYYGLRWHPVKKQSGYFHAGIDVNVAANSGVMATYDGVFEYSGYSPVNGFYILLSHPMIRTEDGWVLNSLYMHLSQYLIRFSLVEKIFRLLSGNTYPQKPVYRNTLLGLSGDTGIASGYPHLHFQLEFRKEGKSVVINPCSVLGISTRENLTAGFQTEDAFNKLIEQNKELSFWKKEK